MNATPLPVIEATDADSEALADILWWIKGRLSNENGNGVELGHRHVDALRRFRVSLVAMQEIRHRAQAAEHREKLSAHFAKKSAKT